MPGSLCDVLPAAAALLDVEDAVDRLAVADWVGADRIDRVLVVLVDGLGWHLLAQLAGNAPLLASVLGGATGRLTQLDCTFPSTTPTSLVSLGTGAPPGEHGILGFTLRVPGTDRVLPSVAGLAQAFRDAGRPIVHLVRLYLPDGSNADRCRRAVTASGRGMLVAGSPGTRLAGSLIPGETTPDEHAADEHDPDGGLPLDTGLLLSGAKDEGIILGEAKMSAQPPGRGTLVRRRYAPELIHLALLDE